MKAEVIIKGLPATIIVKVDEGGRLDIAFNQPDGTFSGAITDLSGRTQIEIDSEGGLTVGELPEIPQDGSGEVGERL